jgi:death-on-curing protein
VAKRKPLITVEEIIEIHENIIDKYGGESGVLNRGILEFAVDWVNSHPRKSIFWKVAVLMREIISGHPFVDGNKRTGFEVADTILKAKGYKFTASQDEILEFILELAMKGKDIEEVVKWLKSNTKKVKGV